MIYTSEGTTLMNEAVLSGKKVDFTKAVLIADPQKSPGTMEFELSVSSVEQYDAKTILIKCSYNNTTFRDTYYFNRINVYASVNNREILFAYQESAGSPFYVPAYENTPVSNQIDIYLKVENANGVNIEVADGAYVLRKDYDEKISKVSQDTDTLTRNLIVERSRIDNLESIPSGSTSGDAALADIKVGYDGTIYDTPGNAVRAQVSEIGNAIFEDTIQTMDNYQKFASLIMISGTGTRHIDMVPGTGYTTYLQAVNEGEQYYVSGCVSTNVSQIYFMLFALQDANTLVEGEYIDTEYPGTVSGSWKQIADYPVQVPAGAKYMYICSGNRQLPVIKQAVRVNHVEESIQNITTLTENKLDKQQGMGNAGKVLMVSVDGNVVPGVASFSDDKLPAPKDSEGTIVSGVAGQVLESNGDGTTQWGDALKEIEDGSVNIAKLSEDIIEQGEKIESFLLDYTEYIVNNKIIYNEKNNIMDREGCSYVNNFPMKTGETFYIHPILNAMYGAGELIVKDSMKTNGQILKISTNYYSYTATEDCYLSFNYTTNNPPYISIVYNPTDQNIEGRLSKTSKTFNDILIRGLVDSIGVEQLNFMEFGTSDGATNLCDGKAYTGIVANQSVTNSIKTKMGDTFTFDKVVKKYDASTNSMIPDPDSAVYMGDAYDRYYKEAAVDNGNGTYSYTVTNEKCTNIRLYRGIAGNTDYLTDVIIVRGDRIPEIIAESSSEMIKFSDDIDLGLIVKQMISSERFQTQFLETLNNQLRSMNVKPLDGKKILLIGDSNFQYKYEANAADSLKNYIKSTYNADVYSLAKAGATWEQVDGDSTTESYTSGVGQINWLINNHVVADTKLLDDTYDIIIIMLGTNCTAIGTPNDEGITTMCGAIDYCLKRLAYYGRNKTIGILNVPRTNDRCSIINNGNGTYYVNADTNKQQYVRLYANKYNIPLFESALMGRMIGDIMTTEFASQNYYFGDGVHIGTWGWNHFLPMIGKWIAYTLG